MATRDETKAWVRAVLAHLGMKPTELARKIGRAPSTVNRFLNDPGAGHDLSPDTVARIAEVAKIRPYQSPGEEARRPAGAPAPEAYTLFFTSGGGLPDTGHEVPGRPNLSTPAFIMDACRSIAAGSNSVRPWVYDSNGLINAGYMPGDVLLVDLNEKPKPHDVVCAQVYDWHGGRAQTVFRLYEPPYLLASTTDAAMLRPLVVDDDVVVIKGVVVASLRPRRTLSLAA